MDKTLTANQTDQAADYEAQIDRYIADMELIQQRMTEDQQDIKALQDETRNMLNELMKAA